MTYIQQQNGFKIFTFQSHDKESAVGVVNMEKSVSIRERLIRYLFEPGYKYISWYRITSKLYQKKYLFPLFIMMLGSKGPHQTCYRNL